MTLAPDDPRHGTENGYSNGKCRCIPCRVARRAAERRRHEAKGWTIRQPAPFVAGPERERDERAWNGRLSAEYGCTLTLENDGGETLTLHRAGRPETVLGMLCDEALQIDGTLRVISYSSPATILADVTGPPTGTGRHREATVLGMVGRLQMLHPRLRGRSSWAERKYRELDALAG